jgi:long-subunit acyl-CoA synthetase (AMP-forming)
VAPHGKVRAGTVGQLLPNTEAKIVNVATGATVQNGEPGELLIRGPQVMMGYLNRPDATKETVMADGFLRTGDVAVADSDNYFQIVDRVKGMQWCVMVCDGVCDGV